jgi:tyrosyl-tRNA synthetase
LLRFADPLPGEQAAVLVNNADWLDLSLLTYLRDVASRFSVNTLLRQETFSRRIENGRRLSLLEFQYPALQAFDFLHLFRTHACAVQVGGSDQWGNIVAGIDFVRHATEAEGKLARVHGVVFPLLLDRGTGQKMGKTSNGQTIWLDPGLTPPFAFFQFWLGTPDTDLRRNLALFTFLPDEEVDAVAAGDPRSAQRRLAFEVTALVHGRDAAEQAQEDSRAAFAGVASGGARCAAAPEGLPVVPLTGAQLAEEPTLASVLVLAQAVASLSAARRLIEQGAVRLNGQRVSALGHRLTADDLRGEPPDGPCAALLQYGRGKALRVAVSG